MKECIECKQRKILSMFRLSGSAADGRVKVCNQCRANAPRKPVRVPPTEAEKKAAAKAKAERAKAVGQKKVIQQARKVAAVVPGARYHMLEVIEQAGEIDGKPTWRCRCDCGGLKVLPDRALKYGMTKSCGCLQSKRTGGENNKGKRFGRLVVVRVHSREHPSNLRYLCQCDCGNSHLVYKGNLASGTVQSCGCLKSGKVLHSSDDKELVEG